MIVQRGPQRKARRASFSPSTAQPDGTVARKRFWRGNFLFAQDPALGGPGFKRFRPVVLGKNGVLRRVSNDEIAKNSQYADFSVDQSHLGVEDFYDRMDDVDVAVAARSHACHEGGDRIDRNNKCARA